MQGNVSYILSRKFWWNLGSHKIERQVGRKIAFCNTLTKTAKANSVEVFFNQNIWLKRTAEKLRDP